MKKIGYKFLSVFISFAMAIMMIPLGGTVSEAVNVTRYEKASSIESGAKYVIVYEDGSNNYALASNNYRKSVTISQNQYNSSYYNISTVDDNSLWTITSSGSSYKVRNQNNSYLRIRDNRISFTTDSSYTANINYQSGVFTFSLGYNYLRYNNGFTGGPDTSNTGMTLYKQVTVSEPNSNVTETEVTNNVKYLEATVYDFDASTFNNSPEGTDNLIFVNVGSNSHSNYVNNYSQPYVITQGIVNDTLDRDHRIVFNNHAKNKGIFAPAQQNITGRTVWESVQFPFVYTNDGYYEFDSRTHHVHMGEISDTNNKLKLYEGSQTFNGNSSFFPFNYEGDQTINYHFGMSMSIPFYMNEEGKDKQNNKPYIFDFSGDDDVWIFINDKLVLDIGGIHGVVGAKIDFSSGKITYYKPDPSGTGSTSQKIYNRKSDNSEVLVSEEIKLEDFGITNQKLALGENNLQIYYLERGAGHSNCKIKCNLLQKDRLEISKKLGKDTPYTTSDFDFQIFSSDTQDGEYTNVGKKLYSLYQGTSLVSNNMYTTEDGKLSLKAGQKAVLADVGIGYYKVKELTTGYETYWEAHKEAASIGSTSGEESPTIHVGQSAEGKNTRYIVDCKNSSDVTLNDDYVVLDFGKPIKYNVRDNDNESSNGMPVCAIGEDTLPKTNSSLDENYTPVGSDLALTNGTANIDASGNLTYTPTKYMSSIDKANYVVNYKVDPENTGDMVDKYAYATVNILPATSVYYEDDFGTTNDTDTTNGIVYSENWTEVTEGNGKDNEQTGDDVYGTDTSYKNDNKYSNGSAHKVTVNNADTMSTASFTFTGTGVEIYSRTDNDTGLIRAILYRGTGENKQSIHRSYVNNLYENGILYQIPTISFMDLEYGEYTVEISVTDTTYYLDGIRVYNPMGDNQDVNNIYYKDDEDKALVEGIRQRLLNDETFDANQTGVNGLVYIDRLAKIPGGNASTSDLNIYNKLGPKNEVYLDNGNAIAFELVTDYNIANGGNVQIGMKAPEGSAAQVKVNGEQVIDLTSATDMYYVVAPKLVDGKKYIVIENTGNALVSLTKMKVTKVISPNPTQPVEKLALRSDAPVLAFARSMAIQEPGQGGEEQNPNENQGGEEQNPGENQGGEEQNPGNDENTSTIQKIFNSIKNFFKNLFR